MQRLDRFESTSTTARPLRLGAGSTIRVCHGRLWLTMDGQLDDVWLAPGDLWVADRPVTVWLSGEPQAGFELLHPVALKPSGLPWGAWLSQWMAVLQRPRRRGLAASFAA